MVTKEKVLLEFCYCISYVYHDSKTCLWCLCFPLGLFVYTLLFVESGRTCKIRCGGWKQMLVLVRYIISIAYKSYSL